MNRWKAKADARAQLARANAGIEVERKKSQLEIRREKQQHKRQLRDQRHRDRIQRANRKRADRSRRDNHRQSREKARRQRAAALKSRLLDNFAGTASAGVYIIALTLAAVGQVQNSRKVGLPWIAGFGFAAILEGGAIAAALTVHKSKMAGERNLKAQLAMFGFTGAAIAFQLLGHDNKLLAVFMAAATVIAVATFELRLSLAVTEAARKRGEPAPAHFGAQRWIVAPIETFQAWRIDVLSRATGQARIALSALADRRTAKRTQRGQRTADRKHRGQRPISDRTFRSYYRTVRTSVRAGHEPPPPPSALASEALSALLDTGDPLPVECPDSVPPEWSDNPLYAARTPSTDTPDSDPDSHIVEEMDTPDDDPDGTDTRREAADTRPDTGQDSTGHPHDTADTQTGQADAAADTARKHSIPADVYTHYLDYLSTHGKPPSARKLAAIAGIGKTTASGHLKKLKENTQ